MLTVARAPQPFSDCQVDQVRQVSPGKHVLSYGGEIFNSFCSQPIHHIRTIRVNMGKKLTCSHIFAMVASHLLQLRILL